MVRFIDDHRDAHGIESICAVVPIAPSTYFRHKAQQRDLQPQMPGPARRSAPRGDSARVGRQPAGLRTAEGLEAAAPGRHPRGAVHRRAADAGMGLRGAVRGRAWVTTTRADTAAERPADLVDRHFTATRQPALGRRLHLCCDLARVRLCGCRHRRLRPADRRLARLGLAAHRVRPGRA